jgi:predicted nucleotide-binding protein
MTIKQSSSIIPRFTGKLGKKNLLMAICAQRAVAGDAVLAQKLIKAGKLCEHPSGKVITRQGDCDNDLYMIVSGSVGVTVNKREISTRSSGTHIGEMALLDTTSRRSASIVVKENTVLLKIAEPAVSRIASDHPEFWRRLAVELAARLRERSKFIHEPNSDPQVFIGSASEALPELTCLTQSLERRGITCTPWTQGVFQLSRTTIEDLVQISQQCDFAILFLTPDDMTFSRSKKKASPRDNVVFELGLFMGAIGRDRTYIVVPHGIDLKLPTDLLGVLHARYDTTSQKKLGHRLRGVTRTLSKRIQELGPR